MAESKSEDTLADEVGFANILYYGKPKSGKTTAAASAAKLGKTVYVDAEAGLKRGPLMQFGIPVTNIVPFRNITFEALDKLFWELLDEPPVALVWDSTSESHKQLLTQTAEARVEKTGKGNRAMFEIGDYGVNTNEMRILARQFRDLKCHTAFVALEKREQDEETGVVAYGPDLTAKLASDVLGYVDVICHTYTKEIKGEDEPQYWGAFRSYDLNVAGDRFHMLPPRLINPSMDRVVAYLNGDLDLDSDEEMHAVMEATVAKRPNKPEEEVSGEAALIEQLGATEIGGDDPPPAKAAKKTRPPRPASIKK